MPRQGKKKNTRRKRSELTVPQQEERKARRKFQTFAMLCNLRGGAKSRLVKSLMKQWRKTSQVGRTIKS